MSREALKEKKARFLEMDRVNEEKMLQILNAAFSAPAAVGGSAERFLPHHIGRR